MNPKKIIPNKKKKKRFTMKKKKKKKLVPKNLRSLKKRKKLKTLSKTFVDYDYLFVCLFERSWYSLEELGKIKCVHENYLISECDLQESSQITSNPSKS